MKVIKLGTRGVHLDLLLHGVDMVSGDVRRKSTVIHDSSYLHLTYS